MMIHYVEIPPTLPVHKKNILNMAKCSSKTAANFILDIIYNSYTIINIFSTQSMFSSNRIKASQM